MDDLTGQRLNDYQLLRQLGRGAMAAVYLAEQQSLARRVAVKVLSVELSRDPEAVERFQHEARAAASLVHPGIVQVYEVGTAGVDGSERHYLAQEYVAGGSVGRLVERSKTLPPGKVLEVLWQVGAALDAAADRGLVHRDIKPDNLMLDRSGAIKVADFGLARLTESNGPRMTQAGVAMGTPLYMSPEQIEGGDVDSRSDLYSLGVTAYQLLSGDPPFTGDTPLSVAVQHLNKAPTPVGERCPNSPPALAAVVDRLIAKAPDERFASPAEMLERLAEVARVGEAEGWVTGPAQAALGLSGAGSIAGWSPSKGDDSEAVERLSRAMRAESESIASWRGRRWGLAPIAVAAVLLGLALGRATTPGLLPGVGPAPVQRFDSPREQLFHAKLVDTPRAWQAVVDYHPEADVLEHRLALRGAALAALGRDVNRTAERALRRLEAMSSDSSEPDLVAAVARVVAYERLGRRDAARTAGAAINAASPAEAAELERLVPALYRECRTALGGDR